MKQPSKIRTTSLSAQARKFADGGKPQESAEEIMARMNAKYGVGAGQSAPQPAQPQPQQQTQPATVDRPQGIVGLMKSRGAQIDRAVNGYSRSGLVAYARGGKIEGPGTPTSDSIPAVVEETGEPIRVANQERILSKAQDDFLANIAKQAGFESVDAFLEAGTGKPVGPTIKGGKRAASNGLSIADDFTRAANSDTGLATMIRPFRDAQKQMPDIPPEDAAAYAKQAQPTGLAAAAKFSPTNFNGTSADSAFNAKPAAGVAGMSGANPDAQFMTGKAGAAAPDSSGGGFFSGDKAFNVNSSSQEGISKVTAKGTLPLYTNIKPEDAVAGLKNQIVGGDPQEGLARYARANDITQSIIDNHPVGGIGIINDPNDAANAEKSARWRVDDLITKSKVNPAAAQAIPGTVHNQGQAEAGQLAQQTAATGLAAAALRDDKRNALESRGQDMHLMGEEIRVNGNPLDNKAKQAALDQQKQVADLHAKYLAATDPKERAALADQIRGISGKGNGEDDVVVVPGGEFTDPDNSLVKLKGRPTIYNKRTGQFTYPPAQVMTPQPAAPKAGEIRGGYKFKGGNPADQASWEKA